jgi:hypothetical protein
MMMHFFLSKICFTLEHYCIFHWLAGIVEGAYRIAAAGRLARADTQLFAYNVVRESNKAGVGKEEVDTCVCVCARRRLLRARLNVAVPNRIDGFFFYYFFRERNKNVTRQEKIPGSDHCYIFSTPRK